MLIHLLTAFFRVSLPCVVIITFGEVMSYTDTLIDCICSVCR